MVRRFAFAALLIAAFTFLSACAKEEEEQVKDGETEGIYLTVGDLKYQVQISRVLNPYDIEDREYLYQVPAANANLGKDNEWFGVFMRVQNTTEDESLRTASEFEIEDTTGAVFHPIEQSEELNSHFYNQTVLDAGDVFPELDTTAGSSTTQGALLLFKIPTRRMENRPLVLHIFAPTGSDKASVDLDV